MKGLTPLAALQCAEIRVYVCRLSITLSGVSVLSSCMCIYNLMHKLIVYAHV